MIKENGRSWLLKPWLAPETEERISSGRNPEEAKTKIVCPKKAPSVPVNQQKPAVLTPRRYKKQK